MILKINESPKSRFELLCFKYKIVCKIDRNENHGSLVLEVTRRRHLRYELGSVSASGRN